MTDPRGGESPVRVRRLFLSGRRERFRFPADSYHSWSLITVATGRFRYRLGPGRHATVAEPVGECRAGSMVLCPPATRFERELLSPAQFLFVEFDVATIRPWWPAGRVAASSPQRLRNDLQMLDQARGIPGMPVTQLQRHILTDLLILAAPATAPALEDPLVAQATRLLEERAGSPQLSLSRIAHEVGLSASQLTRRFAAVHGTPPLRYVTELRLGRARRLLVDSDRSVTEIAAACGYGSVYYFSRAFKREMGQSPKAYRSATLV